MTKLFPVNQVESLNLNQIQLNENHSKSCDHFHLNISTDAAVSRCFSPTVVPSTLTVRINESGREFISRLPRYLDSLCMFITTNCTRSADRQSTTSSGESFLAFSPFFFFKKKNKNKFYGSR